MMGVFLQSLMFVKFHLLDDLEGPRSAKLRICFRNVMKMHGLLVDFISIR